MTETDHWLPGLWVAHIDMSDGRPAEVVQLTKRGTDGKWRCFDGGVIEDTTFWRRVALPDLPHLCPTVPAAAVPTLTALAALDVSPDPDQPNAAWDAARSYLAAARWARIFHTPMALRDLDNEAFWPYADDQWAPSADPAECLAKAAAYLLAEMAAS